LTIRNSRLTPIAGSRLAGSRVRTCRTANRELRIAACDSPLHTACVLTPPALAGAVDCGRKKLPFAGYSVVKESLKRSALRLLEVRPHPCGLRPDRFSPNSWARVTHNRPASYCAPGATRPNLRLLHQRHRSAS